MIFQQDPKQPTAREQIVIAVTIAGLSTLATSLITWGVDELRSRFGSKPEEKKPSP